MCCMSSGESRLREIFIKTDNDIKGRYFAELIKVRAYNECVCNCEVCVYMGV